MAFATLNGLVAMRFDAAAWPAHSAPVVLAPGTLSSFSETSGAYGPEASRAMFAWRSGTSIFACITDANGNAVSNVVTVASGASPSVSWNGSHFVIAWSAGASIVCKRFDSNALPVDAQPIVIANSPGHVPAAASIAGETLVAWVGEDATPNYRVRGARISAAGTVLDPGGFIIYEGPRASFVEARNQVMDVAAIGNGYHVIWIENRLSCGTNVIDWQDVYGAVVSSGPPPAAGPARILSASEQQDGMVATTVGDRFWTAWNSRSRSSYMLLAARRDQNGFPLDPAGIGIAAASNCGFGSQNTFYAPAADGNANFVLTAWRHAYFSQTSDELRVQFCIYTPSGVRIGCSYVSFVNRWNLGPMPVAVAARDTDFLIAYSARASTDSVVMAWTGIDNAVHQVDYDSRDLGVGEIVEDAASNGDSFLVSWSKNGNGRDSFVGRIDGSFHLLDPNGISLATGPGDQLGARLASDGNQFLAVWMDGGTLRASRIDTQGSVWDPGGVVVTTLSSGEALDVDWDGTHYVVAWADIVGGVRFARLKRLATDLSSPDPVPVELAERHDTLKGCRVASLDGTSLITFTRKQLPDGLPSGYGILYHNPAVLAVSPGSVPVPIASGVAPNPFWSSTEIVTGGLEGQPGILRIIDASGRLVREVRALPAFDRTVRWDGRDEDGSPVSSGTYFYEISTSDGSAVRGKVIKLR
jgi:hypothetical protein